MAIQKYTVEVTRVDEYEIEIDDSIWTDEVIKEWSESFFEIDENNHQESFVKNLSESLTHQGIQTDIEGFGFVKQRLHKMKPGDLLSQYSEGLTKVTEDEYTKGLLVNIIAYKDDYETETFDNDK